MIKGEEYNKISEFVINIISSNNPDKAVSLISKIKLSTNKIIGLEKAMRIYNRYSDNSNQYNLNENHNNISSWMNKIENNVQKSKKINKNLIKN
jgi:hypothetical protein